MKYLQPLSIFLLAFFSATTLLAGGLSGRVTDSGGAPLSFATIFVQQTGSGTTTNEEGYYEIRLDPGRYTLIFQFLGYRSESREVVVGSRFELLNVTLQAQPLQLREVEVYEGLEDPAYTVMRKAIAKASYHRQQLDSYEAEVYIKGSGRLKSSPFFLRKAIEKEGIDSTMAFTSESVSRVRYQRPNTFEETVISIYAQGDANETSPNSYINGSFYEPQIAEAISPLSPQAFAYYKFQYEGFFLDRGYGVNKIRVIPRSRGEDVFEGLIFIVEDWWSIYSLALKTYKLGFSFGIDQVYAPIEDKAWLPVSHKFNIEGKILGFNFEYQYLATASKYKISLNPELDNNFQLIDEKLNKELAAQLKRSREEAKDAGLQERLASGGEITRKELRQMMREYEKQERKAQPEPEVIANSSFTIDSLARKRDSLYWAEIRPVPLTVQEVRGYARVDSLARVEAQEATADSLDNVGRKKKSGGFSPLDILGGSTYKVGDNQRIAHASLWDRTFFNPVEGFNMHTDLSYSINKTNRFAFTLTPRYAFARNTLTGKGRISYSFGEEERRNTFNLEGGRYIYQYNAAEPISNLFNTYLNLVEERNYISLYEKDFLRLSHQQRFRENFEGRLSAEWAQRYTLENNTTQTWLNREDRAYAPNQPDSEELPGLPATEKAFVIGLYFEARPWQKYRIQNDKKEPIDYTSPSLQLSFRQGLPSVAESVTDFSYLELGLKHKFRPGVRGTLDFKLEAGLFLNNNYAGFADYRHFMGNRTSLATSDPVESFRLLPYYQHSTQDKFAAAYVHYQFRKFLFTRIPEVWLLGLKENLFVNYLATPTSRNYTEFGYSIDNIFRIFRLEAAVSFQEGKYRDWGVLLGIASNIGGNFSIR